MANYWNNKEEWAAIAAAHTEEMSSRYADKIAACVRDSYIYGPEKDIVLAETNESLKRHTSLVNMDSVEAVLSLQKKGYGKIAVLNFASYKNPGGMFMQGSSAQEEALCHASFIYNVLREFEDYYAWNRKYLNKGMYMNRAIYSPDVVFTHGSLKGKADVITCAAPNIAAGRRYNQVTEEENLDYFTDRCRFVAKIALEQKVDTLILGAWGCGVFGQNPDMVADIMVHIFTHADIPHVKFAVPERLNAVNYEAFEKELKGLVF